MTQTELEQIGAGKHWLNRIAEAFGLDAEEEVADLEAYDWPAGEIALAMMDRSMPQGVTRGAKVHLTCWPWEKSTLIRAAGGLALEEWARPVLIEAATKELSRNGKSLYEVKG